MKTRVLNLNVYSNPYQTLLYSAIANKYELCRGSIDAAITQQILTKRSIYHVHWEESLFARCGKVAKAVKIRKDFIAKLRRYVALGGKVVWTVHNVKPHEWRFVQTFITLRRELSVLSHRILVHNHAARVLIQEQTGLDDLSKVLIVPHPAYFDCYEPQDKTLACAATPVAHPRTLLYFGFVRAYKGIPQLVKKLSPEFMARHGLALHICGEPMRADSFLTDLVAATSDRAEITLQLSKVPGEELADLLRSYAGVVIPYHKVVSSGVAVLALTLGVPTVAPDTEAMRELFPESSHQLLFNPRSVMDFRRAVLALMEMSPDCRSRIAQDYIEAALKISPQKVSAMLGEIYDELLSVSANSQHREGRHSNALVVRPRFALISSMLENKTMTTREKPLNPEEMTNQQLALELVRAVLLGSVRQGIPDELILNSVKDANTLTLERARLDGAYAVRLYKDILARLNKQEKEAGS